jgi:drug/metabolite transporter (DMT)-like permease
MGAQLAEVSVSWQVFLPILFPVHLAHAAPGAMLLQAVYQGLLVGVVSLFLYTRTVSLLGAVRATLFLPLIPVVTGVVGGMALGEWPSGPEVVGMAFVVTGMVVALRS